MVGELSLSDAWMAIGRRCIACLSGFGTSSSSCAVARRRPPASVLVAMGHDQCEAPKHPSECISQRQADHKEAAGSNREEDQGGREGGGGREEGGAPRRKASQGQDRPTIDIKASGDKQ